MNTLTDIRYSHTLLVPKCVCCSDWHIVPRKLYDSIRWKNVWFLIAHNVGWVETCGQQSLFWLPKWHIFKVDTSFWNTPKRNSGHLFWNRGSIISEMLIRFLNIGHLSILCSYYTWSTLLGRHNTCTSVCVGSWTCSLKAHKMGVPDGFCTWNGANLSEEKGLILR